MEEGNRRGTEVHLGIDRYSGGGGSCLLTRDSKLFCYLSILRCLFLYYFTFVLYGFVY